MKTKLITIIAAMSLLVNAWAQDSPKHSFSVMTGGIIFKNSLVSTNKIGYEWSHFGVITDFTYDTYKETWEDKSRSYFDLYALSISGRYYSKKLGRGLFGEVNLGLGRAALTTKENNLQEVKKQTLPLAGLGAGWRFGKKPKGLFGEIGYRFSMALSDAHLYTTDQKPGTDGLDNISYQSWLFEKGKGSGQLYAGIGFSF